MNTHYDSLPPERRGTLDSMALGIATKEELDVMIVKEKMVKNINKLTSERAEFLVGSMTILIHKSTQDEEKIDDTNTQKEFISFLISLYY